MNALRRFAVVLPAALLAGSLASGSALAQTCADCDGATVTVSGTVSAGKIVHEGSGKLIDCITLTLDSPLCVTCDFVGGQASAAEIQLVDTTGKIKLPTLGRATVTGQLVPGETAWYCRPVGVLVSSIDKNAGGKAAGSKDEYPAYQRGNGTLGYGIPDKVIADPSTWAHGVRKALAAAGLQVRRVEFYKGGAYPVFFVSEASDTEELRTMQLHSTGAANATAGSILKANAQWSFELVTSSGDRLRYNGVNARKRSGFDLFLDEGSGFSF